MTPRDQVEAEIRQLLATETSAVRLSNTLFSPGGLFSRLYSTPDEKKAVINSPLFEEANRRLSELQLQEAGKVRRPEKADRVAGCRHHPRSNFFLPILYREAAVQTGMRRSAKPLLTSASISRYKLCRDYRTSRVSSPATHSKTPTAPRRFHARNRSPKVSASFAFISSDVGLPP